MTSNGMRQLEERHMATKVDIMIWSNKMDLLALSNSKGEVALHRLSWQKVWSLSPPAEDVIVKGIAWRPDGKVIAIGYSNNHLILVDVENKETTHKTNYGENDHVISYICWLEDGTAANSNSNHNFTEGKEHNYLPKLLPISRTFGSISDESNEVLEDTKKIIDQKNLNLLIVGLSNGKLYINIFGLFECGIVELPEEIKYNSKILGVEISANLKNMFLSIANDGKLKLAVYDISVLSLYSWEIHALAYKYGQLMSLVDYLDNTMHSISEAYENMLLLEMESKLSQYADSMPEGTVSADFLDLLMFGTQTDALETFLLHDLTDKGIKKLGHSIELSHTNIQKLILKHLQAVGQNIAYHLSELRGMARLTECFKLLGVDESVVAKSFTETGAFLVKANEVILVIDESVKKYKALFKWLYEVILRLSDERIPDLNLPGASEQDIAFIADYLYNLEGSTGTDKKKHCYLDHLGQYLADQDLNNPIPSTKNPWENFMKMNPCIMNNPSIIQRYENLSLVQQYKRLKQILSDTFKPPQKVIRGSISLSSIIDISPVDDMPKVSMIHVMENNKLLIGIIPKINTTSFLYMTIFVKDNTFLKSEIYFKSRDSAIGLKTVDLQIYTSEIMSVLLEQPGEERCAVFVQFPLKCIHDTAVDNGEPTRYVDACSLLLEPGALRPIDNMVACKLAVSGIRKVAVLLSENMHKVRTYEMEVEEDEEEEDMETTRESDNSSLQQSI